MADNIKEEITMERMMELMASEAKKARANITASFTLPDGDVFEIRYRLPKEK